MYQPKSMSTIVICESILGARSGTWCPTATLECFSFHATVFPYTRQGQRQLSNPVNTQPARCFFESVIGYAYMSLAAALIQRTC